MVVHPPSWTAHEPADAKMPGPYLYPAPSEIVGIPTKAELDALPRFNTWESLKDTIGNESPGPLLDDVAGMLIGDL